VLTYLYLFDFYFRWPRLENRCKEELPKGEVDFEELIRIRVECRKVLRHYLSRMSEKFYNGSKYEVRMHKGDDEYIDEQDLYFLIHQGHHMNYYFLIDELIVLLQKSHRSDLIRNVS